MENLRKYPFTNQILNNILFIKLLSEFYYSLNQGKDFLREPHYLVKNLNKINFFEKETKENVEKYINDIINCHDFLIKYKNILEDLKDEDFIKIFSPKGIYNQEIDRGQYTSIALNIIQKLEKYINQPGISSTSEIINIICSKILKVEKNETCFDFAYGKGALALQVGNIKISGMEINEENQEIGNLLLKISNKQGEIILGNSLEKNIPEADVIVSEPPFGTAFSSKEEKRYLQWGEPSRLADLAFVSLAIAKAKNRGAIVVPQGVLFRGGNEEKIRENLIKSGYIEGIISLPNNIMNCTSIPVSIIFFRKNKVCSKIFMLDTTKDFFKKIRGGVVIDDEKLEKLISIYENFKEVENISKYINIEKIIENQSVLTVGRYIDTKTEEININDLANKMNKNFKIARKMGKESNDLLKKLMEE